MVINFNLNGQPQTVEVAPDTPILWVVREQFKLVGSKFGCGAGFCGACTMHVNGQAVRACVHPVEKVNGKSVTTIEGLGTPDQLHPIQAEWVARSVPQCGYCQSGQIMTAAALLNDNPNPSVTEVEQANGRQYLPLRLLCAHQGCSARSFQAHAPAGFGEWCIL